jgi:DNA-binding transcriptional LysR family regulator
VISTAPITDTAERVEAMSVDLGLIETPCNRNTVVTETMGHDRVVIFAAPSHPLARQSQVSTDDLRAASWCLLEAPSPTGSHLTMMLGGAGLDIRFVANTNEAIKAAVASGLGLGFASMRVIAREVAAGELVLIAPETMALERTFTLLSPKRVYQGALPKAFAEHLRAWFATEQSQTKPADTAAA